MNNLLYWELIRTFKSKKFCSILVFMILCGFAFLFMGYNDGMRSGYDFFIGANNFIPSIVYIVGAVYAGICISSAFEERWIQAAVMAGNSRGKVLMTKAISYLLALAAFIMIPVILVFITASGIWGIGALPGSFFSAVIVRFLLILLVNIASMSICVFISFAVKGMGMSIGANIAVIIIWYGLTQSFVMMEKTITAMTFTTMGQCYFVLYDLSIQNSVKALIVSLVTIGIVLLLSFMKFLREELK